jgi:hypothetical protein
MPPIWGALGRFGSGQLAHQHAPARPGAGRPIRHQCGPPAHPLGGNIGRARRDAGVHSHIGHTPATSRPRHGWDGGRADKCRRGGPPSVTVGACFAACQALHAECMRLATRHCRPAPNGVEGRTRAGAPARAGTPGRSKEARGTRVNRPHPPPHGAAARHVYDASDGLAHPWGQTAHFRVAIAPRWWLRPWRICLAAKEDFAPGARRGSPIDSHDGEDHGLRGARDARPRNPE